MNTTRALLLALLAIAAALAGGYWLGGHHAETPGAAPTAEQKSTAGAAPKAERKLLYYRNPMGLPDTSPVPKKDPMGMDYVAVYVGDDSDADDSASATQLKISSEKIQKLGVRSEPVSLRSLERVVRASGRIEPDERRLFTIAPKFEGYVERLEVNATGQAVAKGQALFEVYSPELVSAQREYLLAMQGQQMLKDAASDARASMRQLADSSLLRLKNWDISDAQIKALVSSGEVRRTLTLRSPVSGVVTEKKAVQGMRFMPGDALYQVADLSSLWVVADVFEQDIGLIKLGAAAKIRINAYPDQSFTGKVSYIYPTLKPETRTISVRIELPNAGRLLKPAMYAQVELPVTSQGKVLSVPVAAVIDSGTRQIVLVQLGAGRFEPREVKLGHRSDSDVEILSGLKEGEAVVVTANFLIDAESNLKAAVSGFTPAPAPASKSGGAGHKAEGTVDSIDAQNAVLSVSHGPVASLKWPAMTMEFKLANTALLHNLKPGAAISFEFVERQPGEWVITALTLTPRNSR